MKILYVTHEFPLPAVAGHHIRTLEIIAALPRAAKVHLVGYSETTAGAIPALPHRIAGAEIVPGIVRLREHRLHLAAALIRAMMAGRPYSIAKYPEAGMLRAIRRHCRRDPPDAIVTSIFTRHMIPPGPWRILLDVHNIEHALWESFAPRLSTAKATFVRREARLLKRVEASAWDGADGIIAISAEDRAVISANSPATPVRHVPVHIAAQGPGLQPPAGKARFDIGMIGVWTWAPNAAALDHFAQAVLPDLARAGLRVRVAGKGLGLKTIARLKSVGVDCPGHIPEIGDFYRSVRLVAAPYTLGGGVRMKVAESLGWGRPVVGTDLAFRGIGPGVPTDWIVEDVGQFAEALIRHAADPPTVPSALAAAHSRTGQRQALESLFEAAGVTARKPRVR